MATGITKRHSKGCRSREGGRCNCGAGWEASVYSRRDGRKIRKSFGSEAEAKSWRAEAMGALDKGTMRAPSPVTLERGMGGVVRGRQGRDDQKPRRPPLQALRASRLRGSDAAAGSAPAGPGPALGASPRRPPRLRRRAARGRSERILDPSRALAGAGDLPPCDQSRQAGGQSLRRASPARRHGRRERYASPDEAESLIAKVPERDRAIWATAFYGGLRLGELRALRVEDVDLAAGVIRVERGWDPAEGVIELKSKAGRRSVPIAAVLRDHLAEHMARSRREGSELIFGNTPEIPFTPNRLQGRADDAWKDAELERITPHECRHTFASLMIAAGVNAKALSTFMGHATISITLDRYGHLMPGSEEEAASLLDAYLEAQRKRAEEKARAAAPTSA